MSDIAIAGGAGSPGSSARDLADPARMADADRRAFQREMERAAADAWFGPFATPQADRPARALAAGLVPLAKASMGSRTATDDTRHAPVGRSAAEAAPEAERDRRDATNPATRPRAADAAGPAGDSHDTTSMPLAPRHTGAATPTATTLLRPSPPPAPGADARSIAVGAAWASVPKPAQPSQDAAAASPADPKAEAAAAHLRVTTAIRQALAPLQPVRLHVEADASGASVWIGVDSSAAADVPALVASLAQRLARIGVRLRSVVCNGIEHLGPRTFRTHKEI